jgi:Receptor family ligand binding region
MNRTRNVSVCLLAVLISTDALLQVPDEFLFKNPKGYITLLQVPDGILRRKHFSYVSNADINIGHFISIYNVDSNRQCSVLVRNRLSVYKTMDFAVHQINQRQDLLPNVTLGFVQLDDCLDALRALEVTPYFIPEKESDSQLRPRCEVLSGNASRGGFVKPFDVVGVLGPLTSSVAVAVAQILGTFKIPVVSTYATVNSLSDKSQYPFFLRLVPSELTQNKIIIEVRKYRIRTKF